MKLDGTEIQIAEYRAGVIDGETVIHRADTEKILILDETASFILEIIENADKECEDLTIDDIVNSISTKYLLDNIDEVRTDVIETIETFKAFLFIEIDSPLD